MEQRIAQEQREGGWKEGEMRKNEERHVEEYRNVEKYEEIDLERNKNKWENYEGQYTRKETQKVDLRLEKENTYEENGISEESISNFGGRSAGISAKYTIPNRGRRKNEGIFGRSTGNGRQKHSTLRLTRSQRNNQNIFFRTLSRPFQGVGVNRWKLWVMGVLLYCGITLILQPSSFTLMPEDATTLREWVQENDAALRDVYKMRSRNAHDVCANYDVYMGQAEYIRESDTHKEKLQYSDWFTLKRVNWNYMYYAPKEDFVYCKVPKSGSSTWVYNLLKLANAPPDQINSDIGLHKLLRDYYPKMSSSKMRRVFKKSFKLLVVRHPFERVLSAYRDKLENYQRDLMFRDGYYYTMYGKNIVKVYRDNSDKSIANRTEPTWKEFVRYVINEPSSKFDEHWKPIYSLCSPCVVKYDVIAAMETFSEDTQYVINQLGLEEILQVEWIHRNNGSATSDIATKYFSQLNKHQVDQLYEKYRLDFELFDYEYEAYREMAK